MNNEDEFENGLREILSNNPPEKKSGPPQNEQNPKQRISTDCYTRRNNSSTRVAEIVLRIAGALLALILLALFVIQVFQR
ncbi:MAG TPA: hypothetical protein PLE24_12425 [Chitinispirillaceae bacterium]|jgi:hypothetical protein|nr:hypothetical protein [Chitinispirillaceae bacterium]